MRYTLPKVGLLAGLVFSVFPSLSQACDPPHITSYYYVPTYFEPRVPITMGCAAVVSIPTMTSEAVVAPMVSVPDCPPACPPGCEPTPIVGAQPPNGLVEPAPIVPPTMPPAGPDTIPSPVPDQIPQAIPQTAPPSPESQLPPLPEGDISTRDASVAQSAVRSITSRFYPIEIEKPTPLDAKESGKRTEYKLYPDSLAISDGVRFSVTVWNLTVNELSLTIDNKERKVASGDKMTLQLPRTFAWQVRGYDPAVTRIPTEESGIILAIRK